MWKKSGFLNKFGFLHNKNQHWCIKIIADFSRFSTGTPCVNDIPPFIGCFISDKDGKTLLRFEIFEGALENYLRTNPTDEGEEIFDLELIPMFISAFERFSEQINFLDLSGLDLRGTGLKMYCFFCFEKFTITFFLNPTIYIKHLREKIISFFNEFFENNQDLFENFYKKCNPKEISRLSSIGNKWLNELNACSALM
ncbi:MAG: hypothetical protein JW891_13595 [Candidatus Lokiarchaeota archaeon]|nr:hypothetical protein [Candidatus Lokiarchaeota archaeon]